MNTNNKISIIIVNYNTYELLNKCLKNLFNQDIYDAQILVVDNDSSDGSFDKIQQDFDKLTYPKLHILKSKNNGLAAGYNLGIKHSPKSDYYLFLGTDAFPDNGCIKGMIDFMDRNPNVGIATAKLVLRDGSLDMDAHRGFPTPWASFTHFTKLNKLFKKSKLFNRYFMGWCDMNVPHEIDLCISHFMMVKSGVFEKIGFWDEAFFVYGEDVDFCWRAKKEGFKIYYLPQFKCLHYKGVSVGIRKESKDISTANVKTQYIMKKESVRAMKVFYNKNMRQYYPWVVNKIVDGGIWLMEKYRAC